MRPARFKTPRSAGFVRRDTPLYQPTIQRHRLDLPSPHASIIEIPRAVILAGKAEQPCQTGEVSASLRRYANAQRYTKS